MKRYRIKKYKCGIKEDLFNLILFGFAGRNKSSFKNILYIIEHLKYEDYRINLYENKDFLIKYIKGYLLYKFNLNK